VVPIGRPIDNVRLHVLDDTLAPVPLGVRGELYLAGVQVGRGYLHRPELTSERFVPDPFAPRPGARLYRTGDVARWLPSGDVEYLGRTDFQVKLRGFRIELGEIETTLIQHPTVLEAVVVAWQHAPGDQRLVAYFTPREGEKPDPAVLRAHLVEKLPEYMVPWRFIQLDALPLTASNKIDRKALPPPARAEVSADASTAPREAVELKLRTVWEEVLGVAGIGVHDNFFELGGHSLLALKLFDRIGKAFGVTLPIASLFQAPTIATLGQLLRLQGWAPSWSSLVPIQSSGSRPPFFCVHAVGGNVLNYRLLSKHLGQDIPFYGLQSRGLGGNEAVHSTVQEMAAAYIGEMRQERPTGPYQLGGSSSGGVIAYEMAQQLHAAGERVSALIFFDTYVVGKSPPRLLEARAASRIHPRALLLDHHFGHLLLRTPREGFRYLAERARSRLGGAVGPVAEAIQNANPAVRHVIEANLRAVGEYSPRPYAGSAVMLLTRDEPDRAFYDGRLAWSDLLSEGLIVRFVPGSHETMLDEPTVGGVAEVLRRCLA
jgi:aspartate racemase